jgi:signal transduction histidine kinase
MLLEREGEALSPGAREDLTRIVGLAGGTEDMIRDLLGLFRVTSEPEASARVDVRALVSRALETLAPTIAQKGITVRVGALPRLWGPPRKLGHVVDNLLGNAVKYMPEGRGVIEVLGRMEGTVVVIDVRDNGVGIPETYHEAIFKLFRRVPPEEQGLTETVDGSGVGLALVRRIVTGLGGVVDVVSAPGVGSTFTVRLPAGGGAERGG